MNLKYQLFIALFFYWGPLIGQTTAKQIPYGNNPEAGHYFDAGDAKLYYEVYGKGQPIVMMHGGVYGYIDEFQPFIYPPPVLRKGQRKSASVKHFVQQKASYCCSSFLNP